MASPFASLVTQDVQLPQDPDHSITIRKLAAKHLEQAAQEKTVASQDFISRMGGAAFRKELAEAVEAQKEKAQTAADPVKVAQADPLNTYDKYIICAKGILKWTYEQAVSPDAIADLDEEAVEFLARAILKLSKPSLFETPDEREAARKNG